MVETSANRGDTRHIDTIMCMLKVLHKYYKTTNPMRCGADHGAEKYRSEKDKRARQILSATGEKL